MGFPAGTILSGVHVLHRRMRAALAKLEVFADEARRERASLLSGEDDPEPVLRTIRRLRHDLVMVDRATRGALPDSVAGPLMPALGDLVGRAGSTRCADWRRRFGSADCRRLAGDFPPTASPPITRRWPACGARA